MASHESQHSFDALSYRIASAVEALEASTPPHEGRPTRWAYSDFHSFDATMGLEAHVVEHGLPSLPGRLALGRHITDWRRALPYTEAERQRLYEVNQGRLAGRLASITRQAIKHEVIVDAGIERVIDGNELMQRWWKWRRGIGRLADPNGPQRAAAALRLGYEDLRQD